MSPSSFNDIVPPERRSIRNVTPSHARARPVRPYEGEEGSDVPPSPRPRKGRGGILGIILGFLLILVLAIIGFSFLFSGSRVSVTPKQKEVAIEGIFEAKREAVGTGFLSFEVMTHTKSSSEKVEAKGEEYVEEAASGTIVIYNNHSSTPQRLIKNTRFATAGGLVYRVADSVTVPGQIVEDDKTIPGSIEALVYADKPGADYNIEMTDFTIPGFKGDPRYEAFYARSKSPMRGGFVGNRPAVSPEKLAQATETLKGQIEADIRKEALAQKPEGFYLFEDLMFVSYDPVTLASSEDGVVITQNATLHGILFAENVLGSFLAAQTVAGYDEEPVSIRNVETLSTAIEELTEVPWEANELKVKLDGTVNLVWQFEEADLRRELAGKDRGALTTILSGFPSIEKAEVRQRPFWRGSFPENPEDIKIETLLSE